MLHLLVIRSDRPARLAEFYTQLGLQFDYHRHGTGAWHYSAERDGLVFEIYPLLKNQTNADTSLRLGFTVSNLDQLLDQLSERNVTILRPAQVTEWGYVAVVQDPDGRKLELKEK
ncbi:MAG: VOC family protein [Bacteroidota bacterium]